jgi:protein phosphatase
VKLRWAAVTDEGKVRPHNEDHILAEDPLFAVADGMGGHAFGEVASEIAIETLRASFGADPTADGLVEAVKNANHAVWERAHEQPELRGMGTTTTAAALVDQDGEHVVEIAHVGDSRAYLLRDGELEQLTDDHSLVEDLVRSGRLSPEEAATHPQRHIVTRALGMEDRDGVAAPLEVDTITILPYRGDRILLASDGLTNEVTDEQIASILRRLADPNDAARELLRMANANGGNDNISVVLIDVVEDNDKAAVASKALAGEPAPPSQPVDSPSAKIATAESSADLRGSGSGDEKAPKARRAKRPRQQLTVRTVGFVIAVIAVFGLAIVAITWYAKGSYYVGLHGNKENVTIFRGRPGGFLWVKPTVTHRYSLTVNDVPPASRGQLREGQAEPTLGAARHYITNLQNEAEQLAAATSTTAVPTTTAVPPTSAP